MDNRKKDGSITKKMDSLHRILIPKVFCEKLRWGSGTPLEITRVGNTVVVKDGSKRCCLCGRKTGLIAMEQTFICRTCAQHIGSIIQNCEDTEKAE